MIDYRTTVLYYDLELLQYIDSLIIMLGDTDKSDRDVLEAEMNLDATT